MEAQRLIDEVKRFDAEAGPASAGTPPASWYVEPGFLEWEKQGVFRNAWLHVGHVGEAAAKGDFFSGCVLGEPWVVVHGDDGKLRAFANVCRHHAAVVAPDKGNASELVCPYHGWSYQLDGKLKSAPRLGAVKEFDRSQYGLHKLPLAQWGPFLFVHFGKHPESIAETFAPLAPHLEDDFMSSLQFVERRTYEVQCNWKVFVDNYLDGGYHIPHLHHGLADQLDLDAYATETFERMSLQICPGGTTEAGRRVGDKAVYGWIYPNFMINRYGKALDTNTVIPLGHDRCRVVFDFFFQGVDGPASDAFLAESIAVSEGIQQEDIEISELVQRGLCSSAYDQGRYAPSVEIGEYHFHQLLARDLLAVAPKGASNGAHR